MGKGGYFHNHLLGGGYFHNHLLGGGYENYLPPIEKSDWSDCDSHGTNTDIVSSNTVWLSSIINKYQTSILKKNIFQWKG